MIVTLAGLALGSFASAVSWRVPRGVSWIATGSRAEHSACPQCGHRLSLPDLVPFFSWLVLRGRCRHCRAPIGWRYPAIECATLVGCLAVALTHGLGPAGIVLMLAVPFLVAMIAIDFEHMILPDQINLILLILGGAYVVSVSGVAGGLGAAIGAVVYGGGAWALGWTMAKILRKDALGLGDVKFFAVAGVWLGLTPLPLFLIFAGVLGVGLGCFWKITGRSGAFPFGPALILSLFTCLLLSTDAGPLCQFFGNACIDGPAVFPHP